MDAVDARDQAYGDPEAVVVPDVELSGLPETVGQEVTRILGAAQLAADRIRAEARRDVSGVRARAERLHAGLEGVLAELGRVLVEATSAEAAAGLDQVRGGPTVELEARGHPGGGPGDPEEAPEGAGEEGELSVVEQLRRLAT